jgi:MFS family permease
MKYRELPFLDGTEANSDGMVNVIAQEETREFRDNWPLLVAAVFGGAMIYAPYYSVGQFMGPWEAEFGWRRTDVAVALALHVFCMAIGGPISGAIVTRFGVRPTVLVSTALMGAAFMLESRIGGQLWMLYVASALVAIVGSGTTAVTFSRAVAAVFDRGRGLALGITASASVVAGLGVPFMVRILIEKVGWRGAIFGLGVATLLMLPIVALGLLRGKEATSARVRDSRPSVSNPRAGVTFVTALKGWRFWAIGTSFFLISFACSGAIGQMFPILREKGILAEEAIFIQSLVAIGLGLGRVLVGFVVDRVFAPFVYVAVCIVAALALGTLSLGPAFLLLPACVGLGIATGSEIDILAFVASRYFGLKDYARIFGWLYGIAISGAIVSPLVMSGAHDVYGRYQNALVLGAVAALVSGLLAIRLGPYLRHDQPD